MQGWMVQLSNGEIHYEKEHGADGIGTGWQELLTYLRNNPTFTLKEEGKADIEKPLTITRLSVVRGGVEVLSMPSKQCAGYFQAYESHYSWFKQKLFLQMQGVGSIIGDQVYITWITLDGKQVRQDVRSLESCDVHTTLQ